MNAETMIGQSPGCAACRVKEVTLKIYRPTATVMALLILSLAVPGLSTGQSDQDSGRGTTQIDSATPGVHDFDFLVGQWRVHHRTLKERLANSHEWIEFEGTLVNQPLMGGYSNVDDTVFEKPDAPFRGVALRSFDSKTQQWSIWWLDSRTPLGPVDPPMRGGFRDGVGTFYADETFNGKPVRTRFLWTKITPTSCHWEQAYSPDGGKTWETNWVQDIVRVR
jgi:hypothetical protein